MSSHIATVTFKVFGFEGDSEAKRDKQMEVFLDQLGEAETDFSWDNVEWAYTKVPVQDQ